MLRASTCSLLALFACAHEAGDDDVVGPFTGETRRFVVDSITVPNRDIDFRLLGGDLNGDQTPDNQLGAVIRALAGLGNVTTHGDEMIASGKIHSTVLIVADDFDNDESVSVTFIGADGEDATPTGGRLVDGLYTSNRTATTRVPGAATVHVPVFVEADPAVLPLVGVEIELVPDGAGGFDAEIHGALPASAAKDAAYVGASQMLASYPSDHIGFLGMFDNNPRDWMLSHDEFVTNSLIESLMAPDIVLDGEEMISFGFRVHLSPCAEGSCASGAPTCFDRVENGDETDVDCGGSCRACVAGSTCGDPSDCETAACDGGVCGPTSCDNGVRDGYESDADCGTFCGKTCTTGRRCYYDTDCASGACGATCNPDDLFCSNDYETCR